MPEFLAETYTAREGLAAAVTSAGDLAQAAAQASRPGAPVWFLGAIAVPAEETCFYLYQAPTADAVRAAMTAAGLRPERISPAIFAGPPQARPGTGAAARPPQPQPGPQATGLPRPATHAETGGRPTIPGGGGGKGATAAGPAANHHPL